MEVVNKGVQLFVVDKGISAKGSSRTKKSVLKAHRGPRNLVTDQRGRRIQ